MQCGAVSLLAVRASVLGIGAEFHMTKAEEPPLPQAPVME